MNNNHCGLRTAFVEAGDGTRTRDHKLGRLVLYQLSYSRKRTYCFASASLRREALSSLIPHGGGRIRTFEGVSRQIYSLLPLATWVPHPNTVKQAVRNPEQDAHPTPSGRADGENRTPNLLITNQLLCQLSYVSNQRFYASLQL